MSCWALIPVKARAEGKSRLSTILPPQRRAQLVRSMLRRVIAVAKATPGIDGVAVVTPERDDLASDILVLEESGSGLNDTLARAVATLDAMGAREVVILPADLPRLTPADVSALVRGMREQGTAIASDWRGQGTNGIALDLRLLKQAAFHFSFGEGSFARHRDEAAGMGLGPEELYSPGLALDLDDKQSLRVIFSGRQYMDRISQAS